MSLKVVEGKVEKDHERIRVSYVANVKGDTVLQIVSSMLMLKRFRSSNGVPHFAGPVYAGWENLRTTYGDKFHDLELVGALAAMPDGEFKGQIDWIRPVDGGKIMEIRRQLTAHKEPTAPTHEMVKLPIDLKAFAEHLQFDPILNQELAQTSGGADLIECILRAAVRLAKEEA